MKKRNRILLVLGILPIIIGWLCNSFLLSAPGLGSILMYCGPWIWLAVCFAAADRKGKVFSQGLLLFAVGIVMIVTYICYQAFLVDTVSIFSPLNLWPQCYLGNWNMISVQIYGLFKPEVWSSGPLYSISAVLACVFTFAGVFLKTRFKNVENEKVVG